MPGRRCGGDAFSIDFAHRFPGLRIRPGAYRVWVLRTGLSCNRAEQQLGNLLDNVGGTLPSSWSIRPGTATFVRNGNAQFRIKPAG